MGLFDNQYGGAPTQYGALNFDMGGQQQQQPSGLMKMMGMMKGGGGGGGRGQAMQMGLSAGNQYKDMSNFANIQSLMNMVMSNQNPQRERPGAAYSNPYITSLMGGM